MQNSEERNIKNNLVQENNKKNKLNVSEIHDSQPEIDLRFEIEWGKTQFFSLIIAIIYAISLIILGLSLISVPTAISIYITLFVLVVAPVLIALYCKKSNTKEDKKDSESETSDLLDEDAISLLENDEIKIISDTAIEEIEKGYLDSSNVVFNPNSDILVPKQSEANDKNLSQQLAKNIKPILKFAIYFFIFAAFGVAINLIFLQTIFIYIACAILAIIIFSVGYKIHKINSRLKKLNDVNYYDDHSDDIVTIVEEMKEMSEKDIESQNKKSMSKNIKFGGNSSHWEDFL